MNTHRPCLILAMIFILGEIAGHFLPMPLLAWMILLGAAVLIAFLDHSLWVIAAAMFCLGAAMMQNAYRLPVDSVAFLSYDQRQSIESIEGIVDTDPQVQQWANGSMTRFDLKVRRVLNNGHWQKKSGKVQVHLYLPKDLAYGDLLHVSGKLHAVYEMKTGGTFSYRKYLQDQGVFWTLSVGKKSPVEVVLKHQGNPFMAASIRLRQRFKEIFNRFLDGQEAGVMAMMVLGERAAMPKELKTPFVNTGTAHVLAISGMNMAIIIAIVFFILRFSGLPRVGQFIGTILFLFAYAFLTGWSASVVRACLMAAIILGGYIFELEGEGLNSLGVAALMLLLANPKNIFDIGFQLSFAAVLSIMLLYEPCQRLFKWLPDIVAKTMAISLAAWVGTGPIIFYHFKMITPISIIANIPIVPLADLTVALGLGLGAAGWFGDWVAIPFAGCLKLVFNLMFVLAIWFNEIPWGHYSFQ